VSGAGGVNWALDWTEQNAHTRSCWSSGCCREVTADQCGDVIVAAGPTDAAGGRSSAGAAARWSLCRRFLYQLLTCTLSVCVLTRTWSRIRRLFCEVFQSSKNTTFYVCFETTCQKVVSKSLVPRSFEMSSHTSLSDHCNSFQLFICQSSVFEDIDIYHTQF